MNLLFEFPKQLSFMNVLPLWGWIAILGGVILLILIIIIAVAVSKSKKKKKAKAAESASTPVKETVSEQNTAEEKAPEEKPVAEEKKPAETKVEEPEKEEKSAEPAKKEAPAKKTATTAKKTTAKNVVKVTPSKSKTTTTKTADKPAPKVYHISKRKDDNRWQIKAEGAARAIRLFNTQKEAIDYGKTLAENQGARVMIHKEDGSFRKLTY